MKPILVKSCSLAMILITGLMSLSLLNGCKEPTTIGRYRATPVTNIILDNLGVVDEEPEAFVGARDPKPRDLRVPEDEYVIHKGDFLRVRIFELFGVGLQWEDNVQVNDSGRINVPVIGNVLAESRTEQELTDDVINHLSPHILKEPQVSIIVLQSVEKVFTIQGAISNPGPYQLSQTDFRISRAFSMAGGIPLMGSDYAYVIRTLDEDELESFSSDPEFEMMDDTRTGWQDSGLTAPVADPANQEPRAPRRKRTLNPQEELIESITPMVLMSSIAKTNEDNSTTQSPDIIEQLEMSELQRQQMQEPSQESMTRDKVIRKGDRWQLQESSGEQQPQWPDSEPYDDMLAPPMPQEGLEDEWDFEDMGSAGEVQEVIRINLKKLKSGDRTQNIVVRPGDDIHIPPNAIGIFYVTGQVSRPGPYNMNGGQRMTLRQAVLGTAGPLTPTAWPSRCEITRRIGENEEVTVRFDLQKVVEGTVPDMYIKPGDVINIGSHPVARWLAVVRQSFRSTYGFGFVYDRNLADKDFGH